MVASVAERQVEADLARASRLRQAILKRAFAGQLVPQDPADEPATALLAGIRGPVAAPPAADPRTSKRKPGAPPRRQKPPTHPARHASAD